MPPRHLQSGMRIVLIDDHALFREGVALLLNRLAENLHIIEAASCEEGLALPALPAPDLILLGLGLPGLSGLDGLGRLRRHFGERPVVALSAADDDATVRRAIDAGAMGFIPKTSSSETMVAALQLVLDGGIYLPPSAFVGTAVSTTGPTRPGDLGLRFDRPPRPPAADP